MIYSAVICATAIYIFFKLKKSQTIYIQFHIEFYSQIRNQLYIKKVF